MELDFSEDVVEKLLLKKALSDKTWLNILSKIYNPKWVKSKNISVIIQLVLKFYNKYNNIPSSKVVQALVLKYNEKYPQSLNTSQVNELLSDVGKFDLNVDESIISQNLKDFLKKNAFRSALDNSITAVTKEGFKDEYNSIIEQCLSDFDRVQKIVFSDNDLGLHYFDSTAMDKHWDYIRNPDAKIKTGWPSLDSYTNGGFLKDGRSLYLIMAQAGLGKSVFLSNMAVNFLKQNLKVVVISLEMSEDVYACRFDAHISKKNINKLKENEHDAVEAIKRFYAKYPQSNLIIKEYPPKSITCNDIQTYLENLRNVGISFDVVIVDYLNLVKAQHTSDNMFKDGLEVSEQLRAISYKFNVPVVSACQVNTEGMNNENIGMENLSQSRGVAFTTDFLMALFQSADDRENGQISARLVKNRLGGQIGKVMNFKIDPSTLELADITFDGNIDTDDDESELNNIMRNRQNIEAEFNEANDINSF